MSHSANYRDTGPTTIYYQGLHEGIRQEQERIIKLWDEEMNCECENPMPHLLKGIKGKND